MTRVVPTVDTVRDWIDRFAIDAANQAAWAAHPDVAAWLGRCRLDPVAATMRGIPAEDGQACAMRDRIRALAGPVLETMRRLAAGGARAERVSAPPIAARSSRR